MLRGVVSCRRGSFSHPPCLFPGVQVGTWSDEEYGMVGFQWMYLRFKSFQRFTETCAGAPSEKE